MTPHRVVENLLIVLTPAEIAERAIPSVVTIRLPGGVGSGFVVASDGRIATNLHVIAGEREATVVLADGRELTAVEVLAIDEDRDLAVLRVHAAGLPALPLGSSARLRPGSAVVAIGHPLGFGHTVSDGLISGLRQVAPGIELLQVSAPISPGSSGGPLLDEQGAVVAISTLVVRRGQNLNFGIPIDALKPLLSAREGTPLAEMRWSRRAPTRAVPSLGSSVFEGGSSEHVARLAGRIQEAISLGAPLYNEGHHAACFQIYKGAALEIEKTYGECPRAVAALLDGVRRADGLDGATAKAWAMRDAFDGLLEAASRRLAPAARVALPAAPPRAVPRHPIELLDDCSPREVKIVATTLTDAIDAGAPLYNRGHLEACFRVYETVAGELTRNLTGGARVKEALRAGLAEASRRTTDADKAWAMRDAFDGLLDVVARRMSRGGAQGKPQ